MTKKSKPVEIIGVDDDTVEKDNAFPEAYAFYVQLSDEPGPVWERFLAEWKNTLNYKKREIRVVGDKLRLVLTYGANIQSYVKYVKNLVKLINERVEEHNQQVELKETRETAKQETNQTREDEIRKKLREL